MIGLSFLIPTKISFSLWFFYVVYMAELLIQVIAGRAERAAVIVTTNLPFSEWTTKFPNARLCKAMLDRLTDQAHIIETGNESYRFRRTLEKKQGKGARA